MAKEETEVVVDVPEYETENKTGRILRSHSKLDVDSTYHPIHSKNSVAEIPEMIVGEDNDRDKDFPTIIPAELELSEDDVNRLKQETSHLPFDKVLQLLCYYGYDVDKTISFAEDMEDTETIPDYVKKIFIANIPYERELDPTKKMAAKEFYMSKTFRKVVPTEKLAQFYYNEKNKTGGNWRLELEDWPTTEEKDDLEKKMKMSNISIIRRDPLESFNKPRGRGKRAAANRRANAILRAQQQECSKGRNEVNTDSISISRADHSVIPTVTSLNVATNAFSQITTSSNGTSSDSSTPTPSENQKRGVDNLKFQVSSYSTASSFSHASSTSSLSTEAAITSESEVQPEKQYRRQTIEEQRGCTQKIYPDRARQPPKFFNSIG